MKISKIKISKFHQFEDFELDLTYPKGHEKAGKPLDKVCFIGQSGTGKTTLLEMIIEASQFGEDLAKETEIDKLSFNVSISMADFLGNQTNFGLIKGVSILPHMSHNTSLASQVLYIPSGIAGYKFMSNNDFVKVAADARNSIYNATGYQFLDASKLQDIWIEFRKSLHTYQNELANIRLKLAIGIEKGEKNLDLKKEVEEWKTNNPDPVEFAAKECLDPILNRFFLKIKSDIDDINQVNSLNVCSLFDDNVIPYEHLSTGTKQIIFTAFPIYQLLEDDSIVLMDEPETSLYPDIQREIIPYYTSFDKNKTSQFFFATHSPIIASAFEPWEIVELKFDEKGKVYRDKYYEGENHVDNYRLDPQILRYDQILTRIFDLSGDSDAKRAEKLQELAILKKKVEQLKKEEMEKPSAETQKIISEYLQLSDDISGTWALSRHEKN